MSNRLGYTSNTTLLSSGLNLGYGLGLDPDSPGDILDATRIIIAPQYVIVEHIKGIQDNFRGIVVPRQLGTRRWVVIRVEPVKLNQRIRGLTTGMAGEHFNIRKCDVVIVE